MRLEGVAALAAASAFVVVVAALLVNPLAFAGPANPVPAAASTGPQTWSDLSSSWTNLSDQGVAGTYRYSSFSGASVEVVATNTSATTVALETEYRADAWSTFSACSPDCVHPAEKGAFNASSSVAHVLFENVTSGATVQGNGTPRPALGVLNASETYSATSGSALQYTGPNGTLSGTSASRWVDDGSIRFAGSGLGLVPWAVHGLPGWNATSAFTATVTSNVSASGTGDLSGGHGLSAGGPPVGLPSGGFSGGGAIPVSLGFYSIGPAIGCPAAIGRGAPPPLGVNGTTAMYPTFGGNCSFNGPGNETASAFLPFGGNGPRPPFGNGSSGGSPPLLFNLTEVFVSLTGPYAPGAGLSGPFLASAFFGGALRSLPTILFAGFGGILPGGGLPLGVGSAGGAQGPPSFPPPSGPGAVPVTGPSGPSSSLRASGKPSTGLPVGTALGIFAGVGGGAAGLLLLWRWRRGGPPEGGARAGDPSPAVSSAPRDET